MIERLMTLSSDLGPQRLRLDTLVRLRWLAVLGQSAAIIGVHFGLGFELPFGGCMLVVALSAWLNICLRLQSPVSRRISERAAFGMLAYDVLQLAALLYLTGGLQNPFAILFLAPVLISATALTPRYTLALGLIAAICASALALAHQPLPWRSDAPLELPLLYRVGIWTAIMLGLVFIAIYAWRVVEEARDLAQALAATELVLAREQHLSQLDGLAAAAAHELGTPLATIALVSSELARSAPPGSAFAEDIALLRTEVQRCRTILRKLNSLHETDGGPLDIITLKHLLEEVAGPHRPFDLSIQVRLGGKGAEPKMRRNPGILYGLGNLVENAVDFARTTVIVDATWDDRVVRLRIRDDGPGFPPDILNRIGEPYVTTRSRGRRKRGDDEAGLGLGLFIAKTLIERSGAKVEAANADQPEQGAIVTVVWPRASFEARTDMSPAPMPSEVPIAMSQPMQSETREAT